MRIFEEYLSRHNITDVPLVHHCANGTLLLESTNFQQWKSRWILFTVKWIDHDHRPGHYRIELVSPIHDGYSNGTIFDSGRAIEKQWQEYEDFILDWACNLQGLKPIKGIDAVLAAWEMFVFIFDGWFIKQPSSVKQKLFQSLDKESSAQTRYSSYQDVAIFLSTHYPAVMRNWKYEILAKLQHNADWLACLIERKNESTQKELAQDQVLAEEFM